MENFVAGVASVSPRATTSDVRIGRDRWCGIDVLHIRQEALPGCSWHDVSGERLMIFDHDLQRMAHLITGSAAEPDRSALWSELLLLAAISRLTGLGRSRTGARPNGLSARQIRIVTQYVHENLDQPIRLGDLSAVVGLSASQFARSFKVSAGETPHRWLLNTRLERAKVMLLDRRNRLAEVALATGFSEQSHFTRVFVAANGVPPGRWRRSLAA